MTARTAIGWISAGIVLGLYESTIATFLSPTMGGIDLVLLTVVYLTFRQRIYQSAAVAIAAGTVIDMFSPDAPEIAWLKYLVIILVLFFVSKQFLTNYSIYSVIALMGVGQIVAWIWRASLSVIFASLSLHLEDGSTWSQFLRVGAIDVVCIGGIFVIDALLSKRFVHFRRSSA
ncbi:hypothetical protein KBC54_03895 [Patescibacteria group bacterium]|nr:hypothetical protein [Patescibacteria group bacterium]